MFLFQLQKKTKTNRIENSARLANHSHKSNGLPHQEIERERVQKACWPETSLAPNLSISTRSSPSLELRYKLWHRIVSFEHVPVSLYVAPMKDPHLQCFL